MTLIVKIEIEVNEMCVDGCLQNKKTGKEDTQMEPKASSYG